MSNVNTAGKQGSHTLPRYHFAPIFPVTNIQRSAEYYRTLGFSVEKYAEEYAFATLAEGGSIHLSLQPDLDPKVGAAAAYMYVDNADLIAEKWRKLCPQADVRDVVDTDYGMREGAHLDPDNNLIRFGSKVESGAE
ncbi:Glyoxalase/Bleomycin resistance protein/Dihydroxybiphenyl dioxygenase [Polychaeton citri CBS 116435]|uniref:Glyoxalase/Bleomycin resistance protein/Dihydroxybiphenyl dioxygenase n=1 Tax=Polychaeton citri CBS 116435 TaxID=1314669 RepID=A0A9P4QBZ1_9PEZI|nr:Glyoxalase/Bleomycin resistance protein/Dihydroxybiphenyl dioxygenase [Polychaeton citri CBS 116435]